MSPTKCFVTGGAGFIGTALVKKLLREKNKVVVYDNLSAGKLDNLDEVRLDHNFKFIKGDILDSKNLNRSMRGCNLMYHLAANSDIRSGEKETKRDFNINVVGTLNVLDSMLVNKIKQLVFVSSSSVFGIPNVIPTPENYGPCLPISMYGASKLACEGFISSYSNMFGLQSWIFRLANVTGSPATHGIIFDFVKKIKKDPYKLEVLGDGNQEKSYVTNEMVAEVIQFTIRKTVKQKKRIHFYNIGNDDKIKIKKIANMFIKINKLSSKVTYTGGRGGWKGDVPLMMLSIKELQKLGWKPRKSSAECIKESILANLVRRQ